jgi:hypothetical protein
LCEPTGLPFTQTEASQSTAPKFRMILLPFIPAGSANLRRYITCFMKSVSPMPDSLLSGQKGTRIVRVNFMSGFTSAGGRVEDGAFRATASLSISNSHCPFRFSHSSRCKSGLGCSGRGICCATGDARPNAPMRVVITATSFSMDVSNSWPEL